MTPAKNTIRPLADRIIVNDPEADNITEKSSHGETVLDGVVIPDSAAEALRQMAQKATGNTRHYVLNALAVGEGCKLVKQGDRIVVTEMGLFRVKVGDVSFCGVGEGNVVAVVG